MAKTLRILGKRGRITIPYEIRQRVGFACNDVLSFTETADGRTVIVKREKICDNCIDREPMEFTKTVDLRDFLDDLSEEQQRLALIHLSLKWAEKQTVSAGEKSIINKECKSRVLGAGTACWAEKQGGSKNV